MEELELEKYPKDVQDALRNVVGDFTSTKTENLQPTNSKPVIVDSFFLTKTTNESSLIFEERSDCIKIGDKFCQTIEVKKYGRIVHAGWFQSLAELDTELNVVVSIEPIRTDRITNDVNKNILKLETDILVAEKTGIDPVELRAKKEDLENLLVKLQRNEDRAFKISMTITVYANSREELESKKEIIYSKLSSLNLVYEPMGFRMKDGFTHAFATTKITEQVLTTSPHSMGLPFTTESFPSNLDGTLLGVSVKEGLLITIDPFVFDNPHWVVLGFTGSGKTTAIQTFLLRSCLLGIQIVIVDPQDEYSNFVKTLGGKVIRVTDLDFELQFDSPLICLDTFNIPEKQKDAAIRKILESINSTLEKDGPKRFLVIDEAHLLLFNPNHSELLRTLIKTGRKFNLGLILISQNTYDFLESEKAGHQILGNTALKFVMKIDDSEIQNAKELFNLTEEEEQFIRTASRGKGLLITPMNRIPIEIILTPKELELLKKKQEPREIETQIQEQKETTHSESIYEVGNLSDEQVSELLKNGYRKVRESNINGVPTYFLIDSVKAKGIPSDVFVAIELLVAELRKKISDFNVDYKDYPNFEFHVNNKKIAVVVHLKGGLDKTKLKAIDCDELILMTNARFKKAFSEFKVFTRKEFVSWLEGL